MGVEGATEALVIAGVPIGATIFGFVTSLSSSTLSDRVFTLLSKKSIDGPSSIHNTSKSAIRSIMKNYVVGLFDMRLDAHSLNSIWIE